MRISRREFLQIGVAGLAGLAASGCGLVKPVSAPAPQPSPVVKERPNIYAATTAHEVNPALADIPPRVYVPNSDARTVDVIDPTTRKVVDHYTVGKVPHHVTPSWDLKRLYVNNTYGDSLTELDPRTGKPVATIPVTDPYNLYFTLDGSKALVVAERYQRLDFRDPQTWQLIKSVPIPGNGVDHLDFSPDGQYLLTSTEFSGHVVKVDVASLTVQGSLEVGGLPVDVRLSPDGSVFYVANQGRHGVSIIDGDSLREVDFLQTGKGTHGLHVSRDAKFIYASGRLAGTIAVIDVATRKIVATWPIGGSPDMLQISPDGRYLWASGRYHASVYVVDTHSGELTDIIKVGPGAHGLTYFPQPGRFCLGHNGVYR